MNKCKICGAEIIWIKTKAGKMTPVNADDNTTPHWATCPSADRFRKRKKK